MGRKPRCAAALASRMNAKKSTTTTTTTTVSALHANRPTSDDEPTRGQKVTNLTSAFSTWTSARGSAPVMLGYTSEVLLPAAPRRLPAARWPLLAASFLAGAAASALVAVLLQPPAAVNFVQGVHKNSVDFTTPLAPRYLIDGLTPSADQMNRGDCWLFATAG